MNLIKLKDILFKRANIINKNKGNELHKNNNVLTVQGKKIDDIFHIYGKVKDENKEIRTHIKINTVKESIVDFKCTCYKYELYIKEGHKYYCSHYIATSLKFLDHISKNTVKNNKLKPLHNVDREIKSDKINYKIPSQNSYKNDEYKENNIVKSNSKENEYRKVKLESQKLKIELYLEVKIHYKSVDNIDLYEIQLKIGNKAMYIISDLKNFICKLKNKENIKITNNFIFSSNKFEISKRDLKLLGVVYKFKDKISASKIILTNNEIGELIKSIGSKQVLFKENFLEYNAPINRGLVPYIINLKENNRVLNITTEKIKPKIIGTNNTIVLFKKELYILNNYKNKSLKMLVGKIFNENIIYFSGEDLDILSYIFDLNLISSKVNLSEGLKDNINSNTKVEFYLYKNENIFCEIFLLYKDINISILDKKHTLDNIRDEKMEQAIISFIKKFGFVNDDKRLKFLGNDTDLFNILIKNNLSTYGNVIIGKGLEDIKIYDSKNLNLNIYEENNSIKISYKIDDIDYDTLREIFSAFKEGKEFYRDSNGSFINLLDEKLIEFFNLIDTLNLEKSSNLNIKEIEKGQLFIFENAIRDKNLDFLIDEKSLEKFKESNNILNIDSSLQLILREYQIEGVKWLCNLVSLGFGGILADDMGLGKTLQTITFLSNYINKKTLIVVPTSLVYNWEEEFFKFAPWINIKLSIGSVSERYDILKNNENFDVIITTYGKFKSDIDLYKDIKFDFLIIDEGQNIKNYNSQNAKLIKLIDAKNRFVLSGTPIENNLLELWSIFDFIMPSLLYSKEEFKQSFNKENKGSLEKLSTIIKPFILRRTKDEVAKELPNKYEHRVLVTLSNEQRNLYNSYMKLIKDTLKNGSNIEIFAALTKLRLASLHPKLLSDEYNFKSDKFIKAHEVISNNLKENKKILVFSQFTSLLDLFKSELEDSGIESYIITGKTSSKDRVKLVNDFNKNNDIKVFLISLKAGGVGLNLTSANVVIHFDPWWNPAVENQASDRAHRIGQLNEVNVIKLIAKDTIEEKIVMLQEEKKNLINDVLSDSFSKNNINRETIQSLINSYIK